MMKIEKTKKILALLFPLLLLFTFTPLLTRTYGAGATLFFSPSSGTRYVDNYFSVYVLVNTGGNETNAYKAIVTYPSDKLWISSVSSGGSICPLWIPPTPNYANNQGVATFECGTPSGYNGSAGRIGVITFLVRSTGTATVRIADGSQVKKADGQGTEILASRGTATFILKPAPTEVPEISSSTHPDQNAWYQAKTAELSWTSPAGVSGFSYFLSQNPEGIPDNVSEGTETSKTHENLADGVWYFHLKARGSGGWSSAAHFRIQVDTQAPNEFEIVSDPPTNELDRAPMLSFTATDETSGVDHYEISINGGGFERTESPYIFTRIRTGTHEIIVRAVDRAGNTREAAITLRVKYVPSPVIIKPTRGEHFPLFKPLVIKGTVTEAGTVELFLDGQLLTRLEVTGTTFEYTINDFLYPWEHTLSAILVTEEGIESSPTEVNFKVDPKAISLFGLITLPGWLVYTLLIGAILLLLILLILYLRRIRRVRREIKKEVAKAEKSMEEEFDEMKEDLDQAVEEALQDGDDRRLGKRLRGMERFLRKRIKEEDKEIREDLRKKLDRIKDRPAKRSHRRQFLTRLKKILKKIKLPKIRK